MPVVKKLPINAGDGKRCSFSPWVGKTPWRKAWQPTPVFLPGEFPWAEERGRLQSVMSHRVGLHGWSDLACTHIKRRNWGTEGFSILHKGTQLLSLKYILMAARTDRSVQFSHVWLFVTPWTAAHQASLSITNSQNLLKFMSIEPVIPSNKLIPFRSLLFLSSILPTITVFSDESVLHIRWPKYWNFSFRISPSNEYSGLISFRMDWLDLPAVQGTLKSLLQYQSSKASWIYSAYKLNKQGDDIQPWRTPFPIWNQSVVLCPVITVTSWPAYRFLKRQVRWSGIPISFRIFQFVVIYSLRLWHSQ